MTNSSATPHLGKRLACAVYESLLLGAVLLVASFPFVPLIQALAPTFAKTGLQIYVLLIAGAYFTWFWRRGQTLAMKTWRIRIESAHGGLPTRRQVWQRYLFCCLNLILAGVGWWSALFTPDRQFLQDRLAGTRLISV